MGGLEREHVARARRRLATLDYHPAPVRMGRVRIVRTPWLFRIPGFRRFAGYGAGALILIRKPLA